MNMILQIVISVVAVYLIFSIIVYVIVEGISSLLQLRGKTLLNALNRLIGDKQLSDLLYQHPQINKLRRNDKLPSYIPSANVAVAIIDLIKSRNAVQPTPGAPETSAVFNSYKAGLAKMPDNELKKLLQTITDQTINLNQLNAALEKWYNEYMDRVTGWYKKDIRKVVLAISLAVTLSFNVDSIHIVKTASTDPEFRERMNAMADQFIEDSLTNVLVEQQRNKKTAVDTTTISQDTVLARIAIRRAELTALRMNVHQWDLPVGWTIHKTHSAVLIILGWVITTLALSAGAPFWFDMLKRLVNLRNTGIKPGGTAAADQKK